MFEKNMIQHEIESYNHTRIERAYVFIIYFAQASKLIAAIMYT